MTGFRCVSIGIGAWLLALSGGLAGQQVRDGSRAAIAGTATIAGTVTFDKSDGRPARGVLVFLNGVEGVASETTVTDESGRFLFGAVPAGRFTVASERAGYVTARYGAPRAGRAATPLAVADGQAVTGINLILVKGAVLAGTIRNVDGEPAPDVHLALFRVITSGGIRRLSDYWEDNIGSRTTDDRGQYRIYGLPPGEYAIRAMPTRQDDLPSAHPMTSADLAWAQGLLANRPGNAGSSSPTAARPPQNFVTYAPFYYPGSLKKSGAAAIALGPGEERMGLDFQLSLIPTFTVSATVAETPAAVRANPRVFLVELGGEGGGWYDIREAEYPLRFEGVPPGSYAVAAILEKPRMWAMTTVTVGNQDQNVVLTLQPGLAVSGRVVFRGSTPPPDVTRMFLSMSAVATGNGLTIEPSSSTPDSDGTFSLTGMMPAAYRLFASLPRSAAGPTQWFLRSAMVGDQDIADYPLDLRAGTEPGRVTVTFTDAPTELGGRLQDASGRAASDYFIIVFSPDERTWSERSRRIVQTRPASDGRFSIRGLPPGDYLIAALTDVERDEWYDPGFLRELVPGAMKVTLGEGEHKTQDLQIK